MAGAEVKTVKRVGVVSLARVAYFVDLCALLLTALPVGLIACGIRLWAALAHPYSPLVVAVAALVFHPLLAAAIGAIGALIYNRVSKGFGGLQVELE